MAENSGLDLQHMLDEALAAAGGADDLRALDEVRVRFLGKSGLFTEQLKRLGSLPPEQRPGRGR